MDELASVPALPDHDQFPTMTGASAGGRRLLTRKHGGGRGEPILCHWGVGGGGAGRRNSPCACLDGCKQPPTANNITTTPTAALSLHAGTLYIHGGQMSNQGVERTGTLTSLCFVWLVSEAV